MDGVPYPQPLSGHEPQYVPWGALRVRPIGHPPRPVPPRAADQRSRSYPTLSRELRWGRYGHRGGAQTPGVGSLASVSFGPPSSRPPRPLCWLLPPRFLPWGFPLPRPFLFSQAFAVPCSPPAFSLLPSPRRHFACQFLGRAEAAWRPLCLPPVSPVGPVVTPCAPPPFPLSVPSPPSSPS